MFNNRWYRGLLQTTLFLGQTTDPYLPFNNYLQPAALEQAVFIKQLNRLGYYFTALTSLESDDFIEHYKCILWYLKMDLVQFSLILSSDRDFCIQYDQFFFSFLLDMLGSYNIRPMHLNKFYFIR